MARQQRHLARDDAEFRAPASTWLHRGGLTRGGFRIRSRLRQARNDFAVGAAKVEIDRPAGGVAENDDRRRRRPSAGIHDRKRDFGERACRQEALSHEGCEVGARAVNHRKILRIFGQLNLPG
jgi:hypothetical protein